jgi:hypothetical protein
MSDSASNLLAVPRPLYNGRPLVHWSIGTALAGLVAAYLVATARSGALFVLPDAWPAYVISTLFAALAGWLISRPSISVAIDATANEMRIAKHQLFGREEPQRIPIASIVGVRLAEIETRDGCLYQAEIIDRNGARLPLTHPLASRRSCEAIVTRVRDELRLPSQ